MFKLNGQPIELKEFPDGTPLLRVKADGNIATIEWVYEKNEEMLLYYIASHLRAYHRVKEVHLVMPYTPHARMDRVDDDETVFTLKYFCNFINGLRFDSVTVRDPHSHVSAGMLDNVVHEDVTQTIKVLFDKLSSVSANPTILFFPDEGASKRYAKKIGQASCFGLKTRDSETGRIESFEVRGQLPEGKFNVLIVDDISSYGGTFLHAAEQLKKLGAEDIYLYVTHCENSILKGDLINSGLLNKIYTTNSIYSGNHPLIEVIGGKENV